MSSILLPQKSERKLEPAMQVNGCIALAAIVAIK
jgi:hypothetical protein